MLRALRHRRRWRQADVGAVAGCSQATISRAEAGHLGDLTLRQIRTVFAGLEARVELTPRWRGAALKRLLDEVHAAVSDEVARRLEQRGWSVALEVTYSQFGERGSIDILGLSGPARTVIVVGSKRRSRRSSCWAGSSTKRRAWRRESWRSGTDGGLRPWAG